MDENFNKKAGENICKYRKIQNVSLKELSEKTNINISTLSKIENNKKSKGPSLNNMVAISNALNVPISFFNS